MAEYVTLRRWSLKDGAEEKQLLDLVRDGIIPAYKSQPGCIRLALLRIADPLSYLAVTYWDSKASFDNWAGPAGQTWRDEYRPTLERWLDIMSFEQEWSADSLLSG
jgi:quinol monooxygenase YgiN